MTIFSKNTRSTSRKLKAILFFMLSSFLLFESFGQEVSSADLAIIKGEWKGTLAYTDYGNDKTQYELKTNLTADWKGSSGKLKFYYTEPNGKIVTSTEKIKLISTTEFRFDGKWKITQFDKLDNSSWRLTLETEGKDNNRDATIRQFIRVSKNEFSVQKMVRYNGTEEFFQRSRQSFIRQEE